MNNTVKDIELLKNKEEDAKSTKNLVNGKFE